MKDFSREGVLQKGGLSNNERNKFPNIPSIFKDELNHQRAYNTAARFRVLNNKKHYYECISKTIKHFMEKARLDTEDMARYLGMNITKWKNLEDGEYRNGVEFMIIDEFCTIVGTTIQDFYKKFQEVWIY